MRLFETGPLVSNGTNKTLGDFDLADRGRVQKLIDIISPIMTTKRKPVRPGLRPEDVSTNEFVDPAIGLPGKR